MKAPCPAKIALMNERWKNIPDFIQQILQTGELPDGAVGLTSDDKVMFRGNVLFNLKATHGFPLNFALDSIINLHGLAVDWVSYIETARDNRRWDYQTYEDICHAMVDAELPRDMQAEIKKRFQIYVVRNPHPRLVAGLG